MKQASYLEVRAEVRYWEDATVQGVEDVDGTRIPLRDGIHWKPVVRLADGAIQDWPAGVTASIHYKVCDQGEYWLLDAQRQRIAKWRSDYVPDDILCRREGGYGDYLIFEVGPEGKIVGWKAPEINEAEWEPLEAAPAEEAQAMPDEEVSMLLQAALLARSLALEQDLPPFHTLDALHPAQDPLHDRLSQASRRDLYTAQRSYGIHLGGVRMAVRRPEAEDVRTLILPGKTGYHVLVLAQPAAALYAVESDQPRLMRVFPCLNHDQLARITRGEVDDLEGVCL